MRKTIGINARNILSKKMEGFGHYSLELTQRICRNHPEIDFVLFFDREVDPKFLFSENVRKVVLFPPTRHPFLYVIWFEISLRRALSKYKIDLLWTPDGFCSLGSKVPQIATIHDLNFEHYPKDLPLLVRSYFRFFFPRFARKAQKIITVSNYSKHDIQQTYSISEDKIQVVYNAANQDFKPLNQAAIMDVRQHVSNGKPFFLFVGSLHPRKNVHRLLEAFSQCHESLGEMQLVIVGSAMWDKNFLALPEVVKHKIHLTGHVQMNELISIVGAAYALTFIPYFEGFGIPLVEAMSCGVPIVSSNATCLPEVAGDAAIYCDPFDISSIKDALLSICTDTEKRNELSMNGLRRSKEFSWDKSAEQIAEMLKIELLKIN